MVGWDRVERAAQASTIAALAGLVALILAAIWDVVGQPFAIEYSVSQPFGTVFEFALVLEALAIAPMMVGSYELGGVTPLWPARFSLGAGIGACLVFAALHVGNVFGTTPFAVSRMSTGWLEIDSLALIIIGLWLTGAPPLAGPWLPTPPRWLGALSGLGIVLTQFGPRLAQLVTVDLVFVDAANALKWIGAVGYLVLFPIWAWLMAGVFRRQGALRSAPHEG